MVNVVHAFSPGDVVGNFTIIKKVRLSTETRTAYLCKCSCGKLGCKLQVIVRGRDLHRYKGCKSSDTSPDGKYRRCSKCKEKLKLTSKYFDRNKAKDKSYGFQHSCKSCRLSYHVKRRRTRPWRGWATDQLLEIRHRNLKKFGIRTDIKADDLLQLLEKQNYRCRRTGVELSSESRSPTLASVDRIDNTKPYTSNNIQIVYQSYNIAKNTMTDFGFLILCRAVVAHADSA